MGGIGHVRESVDLRPNDMRVSGEDSFVVLSWRYAEYGAEESSVTTERRGITPCSIPRLDDSAITTYSANQALG